jgi:hypothetical protein
MIAPKFDPRQAATIGGGSNIGTLFSRVGEHEAFSNTIDEIRQTRHLLVAGRVVSLC